MKCLNKIMIFFLFMLFSYGVDISAYTYTISNLTGRDVKIELRWMNGKLNEEAELIRPYGIHKFSFKGTKGSKCLYKIMVSSFDKDEGMEITLVAPFRDVGEELFGELTNYVLEFNQAVKEIGEELAIVKLEEMEVEQGGLAGALEASKVLYTRNFCKDRNLVLVLDYDPIIRLNRVYTLTPP